MDSSEWSMIMRKALAVAFAISATLAGRALADDDCWAPMSDWQPRQAVETMAEKQGWTVRRITIHDGCYKVFGRDSTGKEIRLTVNPVTLEVLKAREHDDHDSENGDRHNKHQHD